MGWYQFSPAAALCLFLLVIETTLIFFFLPETHPRLRHPSLNSTDNDQPADGDQTTRYGTKDTGVKSSDTPASTSVSMMKTRSQSTSPVRRAHVSEQDAIATPLRIAHTPPSPPTPSTPHTHQSLPSASSSSPLQSQKRVIQLTLFSYLLLFSALEFTFPFLTLDRMGYTQQNQGYLLAIIGILSAIWQGGYVRRVLKHKDTSSSTTPSTNDGTSNGRKQNESNTDANYSLVGTKEHRVVIEGMTCAILFAVGLALLASSSSPLAVPTSGAPPSTNSSDSSGMKMLGYFCVVVGMSFASATVVNGINALASLIAEHDQTQDGSSMSKSKTGMLEAKGEKKDTQQGAAMGQMRSVGQLGRALGPILGCALYWYGYFTVYLWLYSFERVSEICGFIVLLELL